MAGTTAKAKAGGKAKGTTKAPPPKAKRKRTPKGKGVVGQAVLLATVMLETPGMTSDQFAVKFNMPVDEIARCRAFVVEYVKDYNFEMSALRMGYPAIGAATAGQLLLCNAYSQLRLSEFLATAELSAIVSAPQVVAGLVKEANAPDVPFSSGSATRINAWDKLARILGLYNIKPEDPNARPMRQVMNVPHSENWEAGARASQKRLKASVVDVVASPA